jgi:hypothetical protein
MARVDARRMKPDPQCRAQPGKSPGASAPPAWLVDVELIVNRMPDTL